MHCLTCSDLLLSLSLLGTQPPQYSWEECQFHFWAGVVNVSLVINLVAVSSLDFKNELGAALIREGMPRLVAAFDFFDPEATIDALLDPDTFKGGVFQKAALEKIVKYPLDTEVPAEVPAGESAGGAAQ
jgi:hypothetical protein